MPDPKKDPTERSSPLASFLCFALYAANHAMNRVYKPILDKLGLTYPQYLVLVLLWDRDGQLVGEIGQSLYLESNTLTPLLKRLEALGHVRRERSRDDERQVRVMLTDSGRALEQAAECVPEEILRATGMSSNDVESLTQQIRHLQQNLRKGD